MSAALDGAVELLDRALAYTRVVLSGARPEDLRRPTPCTGWDLRQLLAHMEDSLDAFTEAADGRIGVGPPTGDNAKVEVLREKACALLGAWSRDARGRTSVAVGDRDLASPLLVATAALEVTVHGWNVSRATGQGAPIPADLARDLLAVAEQCVDPLDRGVRFATARRASGPSYDARLLAFLGRDPADPLGRAADDPQAPTPLAS